ncbi:MAG: PDZ domain-containing protein [Deltaproteobacteria bacterium]|nr:PDZ domain-containing protein [Deltaproteobacteria bacterium]
MKTVKLFSLGALMVVFMLTIPFTPLFALEKTGGIGMTVAQLYDETTEDHKGYLVVLDVFRDSPAQNGGIERGDILTHINGRMTKGKDFMELLRNEIRGPEGKEVTLKIWRYSLEKRLEIKLIRVPMSY